MYEPRATARNARRDTNSPPGRAKTPGGTPQTSPPSADATLLKFPYGAAQRRLVAGGAVPLRKTITAAE